jgi:hypothetical protein
MERCETQNVRGATPLVRLTWRLASSLWSYTCKSSTAMGNAFSARNGLCVLVTCALALSVAAGADLKHKSYLRLQAQAKIEPVTCFMAASAMYSIYNTYHVANELKDQNEKFGKEHTRLNELMEDFHKGQKSSCGELQKKKQKHYKGLESLMTMSYTALKQCDSPYHDMATQLYLGAKAKIKQCNLKPSESELKQWLDMSKEAVRAADTAEDAGEAAVWIFDNGSKLAEALLSEEMPSDLLETILADPAAATKAGGKAAQQTAKDGEKVAKAMKELDVRTAANTEANSKSLMNGGKVLAKAGAVGVAAATGDPVATGLAAASAAGVGLDQAKQYYEKKFWAETLCPMFNTACHEEVKDHPKSKDGFLANCPPLPMRKKGVGDLIDASSAASGASGDETPATEETDQTVADDESTSATGVTGHEDAATSAYSHEDAATESSDETAASSESGSSNAVDSVQQEDPDSAVDSVQQDDPGSSVDSVQQEDPDSVVERVQQEEAAEELAGDPVLDA